MQRLAPICHKNKKTYSKQHIKRRKKDGRFIFGMNKKRQLAYLRKKLGHNADLVDLDARIDSTLSYQENKRIVLNAAKGVGIGVSESLGFKGSGMYYRQKAQEIHNKRSNRSKAQENRAAKTTYSEIQLNKHTFEKWRKNKNQYDISGVDSPGTYQKRTKANKLNISQIDALDIL